MAKYFLILLLFFSAKIAYGSSCCGQSPASFTILSLEQRLNISSSYSYVRSIGRVFSDPKEFFVWQNKNRQIQAYQLNISGTIAPKNQFFINSSVLQSSYEDSYEDNKAIGFSDTQLGYSYELLSEYTFSYWRPIVYITALLNLPTGKSIYDNITLSEGGDVTGHNQWGAGLGLTFKKVYFPLALTLQLKSVKMLSKKFGKTKISSFYDSSIAILANYSTKYWGVAINTGVTFNHLSARSLKLSKIKSESSRSSTLLLGLQKPINEGVSVGLNYSDQTLIGRSKNTILNRTVNLNLNYSYF